MDFWDWLHGLKRWWWMLVAVPVLTASVTWMAWPDPQYETSWTVNITFADPESSNAPGYFDFVFLDDMDQLVKSSLFGDVIYLRLPEQTRATMSRDQFGEMVSSARKAREVEITIHGDDPDQVALVAATIDANLEEVMNTYMVPPDYTAGPGNITVLNPISEPALNSTTRILGVVSLTAAAFLVALAATGVAEWLRMSYRAKYAEK
ncbi:MAG: hypothetical protein M9950_05185 [Thermomicrobiales bacterium]|nr:hypothetical protein [Thermomicrobiales bacterium]